MSKEGFFGPAAFFHHRHPPTGWSGFEGPLRPRALDLNRCPSRRRGPWSAAEVLANSSCRVRYWRLSHSMDALARNADGDELLFVHAGTARAVLRFRPPRDRAGRLRHAAARHDVAARDRGPPSTLLLIEATQRELPVAGQGAPRSARDLRSGDARHAAHRRGVQGPAERRPRVAGRREAPRRDLHDHAIRTTRSTPSAGTASWRRCASTCGDLRPVMSHRYHLPPSAHTTFLVGPLRGLHVRARARSRPTRARSRCRSSTTTTTTTK